MLRKVHAHTAARSMCLNLFVNVSEDGRKGKGEPALVQAFLFFYSNGCESTADPGENSLQRKHEADINQALLLATAARRY